MYIKHTYANCNTHAYILTATSYRQRFVCKWFISTISHAASRCRPISVHYISLSAPYTYIVYSHTYIQMYMYVCLYIYMFVYVCMYMYACISIDVYVCIC